MFKKSELNILSTTKGIEYLLQSDQPDFQQVLKQLAYDKEIVGLQTKMIEIQNWVVEKKKRVLVITEGRDFAGKGGAIHAFTEHLNPRSVKIVALKKPLPREREQWYFKRYIEHIPERGEMVFFDRSWYNRAVVEPVNGFCSDKEYKRFMNEVIHFERMLTEDGIILIKLYFKISKKEQERRIEHVKKNALRRWELTPVDKQAVKLWDTYTKFERRMFNQTNTESNPWHIFSSDDKPKAKLKAFKKVIQLFDQYKK